MLSYTTHAGHDMQMLLRPNMFSILFALQHNPSIAGAKTGLTAVS